MLMIPLIALLVSEVAFGMDNGQALKPPMGWMAWERYRCRVKCETEPHSCLNEQLFREMTDALVSGGFVEAGYDSINIDDCYLDMSRDAQGKIQPDPKRFPSGLKALGDYMHSKGVKFGIYEDEGTRTCMGYPGSENHEEDDAKQFAEWGVDYLKLDGCYNNASGYEVGYPRMSHALNATGRPITYSCSWPAYLGGNESAKPWDKMIPICNLWRNWDDIQDSYESLASIIQHWGDYDKTLAAIAGPGHWNDPDMLLVGNYALSIDESRQQMAMWAIFAAPLFMSADLRSIRPEFAAILKNKEVIAVNQDKLGKQGTLVERDQYYETWQRELADGGRAVAVISKYSSAGTWVERVIQLSALGGFADKVTCRDLFSGTDMGTFTGNVTVKVVPHGVAFVKLMKA